MVKREKENEMNDLLDYINDLNAISEAEMAANPNLMIGMLSTDPEFWADLDRTIILEKTS